MTEMEHSTLAEDEATPVDAGLVMSRKVFALRLGDACPGADAALLKTELLASLETNGRCAGDALWTHGAGDVEKTTRQRELLSLRPRRASNPSVDRGPGSVFNAWYTARSRKVHSAEYVGGTRVLCEKRPSTIGRGQLSIYHAPRHRTRVLVRRMVGTRITRQVMRYAGQRRHVPE
jgi:hypothetical protein